MTANREVTDDYCLNCHLKLKSNFCGNCGQKAHFHANPHLHDVLHEAWHEFFHIDGKIFRTLKLLLFKPGSLTREFFNGRRQRFVTPIRLYLTVSIIYFLTAASISSPHQKSGSDSETAKIFDELKRDMNLAATDVGDSITKAKDKKSGVHLEFFGHKLSAEYLGKYVDAVKSHPGEFKHLYEAAYAKALFLLVPLFALLLQMAFLFRERYPQYLYFSMHYHTALFAIATPLLFLHSTFFLFWFAGGAIYFVLAIKRVWGGTSRTAIGRGIFVASIYSVFFLLALGGAGLYALLKVTRL